MPAVEPRAVETPQTDTLPLLPRPASSGRSSAALNALRGFHYGPPGAEREPLGVDCRPALLAAVANDPERAYPVFLGPADKPSKCLPWPELLARLLPDGAPGLADELRGSLAGESDPVDAQDLLGRLSHDAAQALAEALPAGGRFLPFSDEAPVHLLRHVALGRVRPARIAFREEVRALSLQAARFSGNRKKPGGVTLGALGNRFIDPSALAGVVDRNDSPTSAGDERLAGDLQVLQDHLAGDEPAEFCLVRQGGVELDSAAEIFDREAAALARVVRAVRRLRLALAGTYEPERHDPWLDELDWQAFSLEELRVLPVVAALVSADQVAGAQMTALSQLLLSGRPVQVVVNVDPRSDPGAAAFAGFRFEPAYLALAHREVLVQQSTAARPAHLVQGLRRAMDATHTALHVISSSATDQAAVAARAHPLFHYDPEAGSDWAERLDFSENPDPEDDWPVHELRARREDGGEDVLRTAFTFADFALLDPAYAAHFRPVPDEVPEGELVPVATYCASPPGEAAAAIPFVWAVDAGGGRLIRLAVSRPLALACRDRLDFWRTLQGLAGVRSVYVRRAADETRRDVEARALEERQRLERLHAEELERLRRDAARDVVDRLTAALTDVDVSELVDLEEPRAVLGGFQGRGVDEVAAALMELVDPASLDGAPDGGGDERVNRLASELMKALD